MKPICATLLLVIGISSALHYCKSVHIGYGCHPVEAAVPARGHLQLFVAGEIIVFNSLTKHASGRTRVGTRYRHFPRGKSVDAAFHPARDPTSTILITGNRYYVFNLNGFKTKGPRSLRDIFPKNSVFAKGIDAAANFNGDIFYFKGCTMIARRRGGDQVVNMRTAAIPCNVRAAWPERLGLVVASDRRAVRLFYNGRVSKGYCAFNQFTTSANICKCQIRF